jgi:DNA-binding NtrC family response regulator
VEAEFFGFERGAFTDAVERREGKFELADGGSLFLDEIGDLSLDAQSKLLRVLQDRNVIRLGGRVAKRVDVRIVAATNRDLARAVAAGSFRADLYWRINVVQIPLPALRARRADVPLLIDHFLTRFNRDFGLAVPEVAAEARRLMLAYRWPGNVRELENAVCRAMIMGDGRTLSAADLPESVRGEAPREDEAAEIGVSGLTLDQAVGRETRRLEREMIRARLAAHGGNRTATAESLGVSRKTLFNKMRRLGLSSGDPGGRGTRGG